MDTIPDGASGLVDLVVFDCDGTAVDCYTQLTPEHAAIVASALGHNAADGPAEIYTEVRPAPPLVRSIAIKHLATYNLPPFVALEFTGRASFEVALDRIGDVRTWTARLFGLHGVNLFVEDIAAGTATGLWRGWTITVRVATPEQLDRVNLTEGDTDHE